MSKSGRFIIRVPATSANLGPGFDCLGLAVDLPLTVEVETGEADRFIYTGEGELPDTPHNLVHHGFRAAWREIGQEAPKATFRVHSLIPLARGLGSSSAALVAGAAAADALAGGPLGREGVFQLCARAEGHPDNVSPAVFGGFTASVAGNDGFVTRSLPVPPGWRFLFAVPEFEFPTMTARKLVPDTYPRADAIYTSSRTAMWTLAVATGDHELLSLACQDVLHQPHRAAALPGFERALAAGLAAGAWGAFLSGAGPTLGAVCAAERVDDVSAAIAGYGRVLELPAASGYAVEAVS